MTIYADILFIVNLYIDAMLIAAVRRFLRLPLSRGRWLLAAVLGGFSGLCALLPDLSGFPLFCLTAVQALALSAAAFAPKPWGTLLKATFLLFLFGAALSGLLSLMQTFLPFTGVILLNGTVYFDISPLLLIVLTCLAYGVLYIFDRLFQKREPDILFAGLTLSQGGKTVQLPAKVDTGLTLREPFSGLPVIVAEQAAVQALLPPDFGTEACSFPLRFVPYNSVGGEGLLPAFRPEQVKIGQKDADCWVAVSPRPLSAGSFSALIGAALAPEKL